MVGVAFPCGLLGIGFVGAKVGVPGQFFIKSMPFEGKQLLEASCPNVSHVWYEDSQAAF